MAVASVLGSSGSMGGTVLTGDSRLLVEGNPVAVNQGVFFCPVPDGDGVPHGYQSIRASGTKMLVNGQIIAQMGDCCCSICGNSLLSNSFKLII